MQESNNNIEVLVVLKLDVDADDPTNLVIVKHSQQGLQLLYVVSVFFDLTKSCFQN